MAVPHKMVNGLVLLPPSPFTYVFIIQHRTSRPEPLTAYMLIFYFQPQQSVLSIPSCNNVVKENLALPVTQRLRFHRLWLVSTPLWCHWTTENLNFQFNQIILHQRQIIIIILSKTKRPVAIQVMETQFCIIHYCFSFTDLTWIMIIDAWMTSIYAVFWFFCILNRY